jgi:hypothetical protein
MTQILTLCNLLMADTMARRDMTTVEGKANVFHLTTHGKRMIAESMYEKGKSFIGAALLLRQRHGYEYVVLHLLCQGIEITLKALLLMNDYDKYKGKLKSAFRHNIKKLAAAAISEFNVRPVRPALEVELEMLSSLYSSQRLRYGTFYDVLVNPETIQSRLALRKIAAVIRLADRHVFTRSKAT